RRVGQVHLAVGLVEGHFGRGGRQARQQGGGTAAGRRDVLQGGRAVGEEDVPAQRRRGHVAVRLEQVRNVDAVGDLRPLQEGGRANRGLPQVERRCQAVPVAALVAAADRGGEGVPGAQDEPGWRLRVVAGDLKDVFAVGQVGERPGPGRRRRDD